MRNIFAFLAILFCANFTSAQTATNFTCNDCAGTSHTLFNELDAGNVVVLCWVMPCASCTGGSLTCSNVVASYPSNVSLYIIDDYANTNCTSLNSWVASHGITNATTFSNAAINMLDYGSTGMPKAVVVGGTNHTVFYNANNTFNSTALQSAINQALLVAGVNETKPAVNNFKVYPKPATNSINVQYNPLKAGPVTIELYDMQGKRVTQIDADGSMGDKSMTIDVSGYDEGLYLLKIMSGGNSQFENIIVSR